MLFGFLRVNCLSTEFTQSHINVLQMHEIVLAIPRAYSNNWQVRATHALKISCLVVTWMGKEFLIIGTG